MALSTPGDMVSKRRVKMAETLHNPYTAWIILCVSVILTVVAWWVSTRITHQRAKDRFDFRVAAITKAIQDRMNVYEQALWGGVGLFNASESVSRQEWKEYVDTLHINIHWPGIQGIGFSIPVRKEDKAHHIQTIRAEGFADYVIKPETDRDTYSAIIYLEPFDWRNQRAFGYDMWANGMRRAAMTRARDEGVAATSGMITLVQETGTDAQKGFLTYLPVYKKSMPMDTIEARQRAFVGWVYSPFRAGDLMKGILSSEDKDYEFEIFDGTVMSKDSLLFDSNQSFHLSEDTHTPKYATTVNLVLQGRPWLLYINTKFSHLASGKTSLPRMIAICGFIIDLLLFYVILSINNLQERAETIAKGMTKKLEIQKQELTRSNEELEDFAYIASHDLKEPLRGIHNYATFLAEDYAGQLDDEGQASLATMTRLTKRLEELIDSLLYYSRVGQVDLARQDTDLDKTVDGVLETLSIRLQEEQVEVRRPTPLPTLTCDAARVGEIFRNLLTNAFKYNDKPQKWIEIGACQMGTRQAGQTDFSHSEIESPRPWVFYVRDNGIGIREKHQGKIFGIFKRLHNRDQYGGGTGVGLTIVKKIVERHGGQLWLESTFGEGTTFYFTLQEET